MLLNSLATSLEPQQPQPLAWPSKEYTGPPTVVNSYRFATSSSKNLERSVWPWQSAKKTGGEMTGKASAPATRNPPARQRPFTTAVREYLGAIQRSTGVRLAPVQRQRFAEELRRTSFV